METTGIRKYLLDYIAQADEDKVQAIFTLVKDDIIPVPEEQLRMIQEARDSYQNNKESARPWEEVYETLKAKLSKNAA